MNGADAGTGASGFTIDTDERLSRALAVIAGGSTIRGLVINQFGGHGILIDSGNNLITGDWIGTDSTGNGTLANLSAGIGVYGTNNTIGGTGSESGNVISGNADEGIFVAVGGNLVQGNLIGTNANGTAALGNGLDGIFLSNSAGNTISGNLISGNGSHGINLSTASSNLVEGNKIGVNAGGMGAIGNVLDGIFLSNSAGNTISGNLISGNGINLDAAGINLESNDSNNIIAGNEIGTNAAGDAMLGKSLHGIFLGNGSSNNTIGGPMDNDRNVISGNGQFPVANLSTQGGVGVYIFGANTSGNVVQGNYIGTNATGTDALTNSVIGVLIYQSSGNTVQGNLISGNRLIGLEIAGAAASGIAGGTASLNLVQDNKIGTNFDGTTAIPNGLDGIFISDASNNTIGGTAAGAGNLISGNGSVGIQLFGPLTRGNVVQGNALGLNSAGRPTLRNRAGGIFVNTGPLNNTIGGKAPGRRTMARFAPCSLCPGLSTPIPDRRPRPQLRLDVDSGFVVERGYPSRSLYRSLTDDWRGERNVPAWPAAKGDVEQERQLPVERLGTRDRAYVSSRDHCPAGQSDVHTEGQVDNVRGTADETWLKTRPVERDVQVGLEHRDDGREQGTWILRSVNVIPQRDIEVVHGGQVPVRGDRNRAESLDITLVTLVDVAEERLELKGVDSLGRRIAGEGRGARGKAHVHAPGDQVTPVVLPEHILEERAEIARRCVRAAQAGKPAGDRERVDGDPEADRSLLVQEGLLEAEDLAVDLHVLDWCPELTIQSGIDPVEVVEAHPDAIDRSGILVIGDLEAPDRRHDCGDRSPRQESRVIARPGNPGWNRRGDRRKTQALPEE